jgi:hypothetical protein
MQVLIISFRDRSCQDFDKVWPIFDSAQSRDFRKVSNLISCDFVEFSAKLRFYFCVLFLLLFFCFLLWLKC